MLEAAQGHSISVIAIIVILNAVFAGVAKWKEVKARSGDTPRQDTSAIKEAAVLSHRVAEIDSRTQDMAGAMREMVQVSKESVAVSRELVDTVRENSRSTERLTQKICTNFTDLKNEIERN